LQLQQAATQVCCRPH